MKKMVVATKNEGKLSEIRSILNEIPFCIIGMEEARIHLDIDESGMSFQENALIKAKALHQIIGGYVMADDSGLCIDALGGEPGIYSARYFGENTSYSEKFAEIQRLMKDIPFQDRTAKFVCAIVVICESGKIVIVEEKMDGIILDKEMGDGGFGYDPIFFLPEIGKTTAQLSEKEKNMLSHRGKALRAMLAKLKDS